MVTGTVEGHTLVALGAADAVGARSGWRHFPFRWPDLKRFLIAYAVLTAIAIALGATIVHVLGDGPLGEADLNIAQWFADQRSHSVNHLAQIGAGMADAYTLTPAILLASVLFVVLFRRWNESVLLLTAIVLEKTVFLTTTYVVSRERPPVGQLDGNPPTSSYPSGHVAAAVVFYLVCAIVVCWHTRIVWIRALVWTVAIVVPIAVALSRMLLGMHYISDVTIGAALGTLCLVIGGRLSYETMTDLDARTGIATATTPGAGTATSRPV